MAKSSKLTRRSAIGLLAGGGILAATQSMGYDLIQADRLTAITTSGDEDALVALVDADYEEIPNDNYETVAHLSNNLDASAELTYEISTNQDRVSIRFDGEESDEGGSLSGTIAIPGGESEPVELQCGPPGQMEFPQILTVGVPEARSDNGVTISDAEFTLYFACDGGPVLDIADIRGLDHAPGAEEFTAEIDVEETQGSETINCWVELVITGDAQGEVYRERREAPDDFDEPSGETVTVAFDDIGILAEDAYEYAVTVNADNAEEVSESGSFIVDADQLILDLTASRDGARDLVVDLVVQNGGPVEFDAVGIEHDPDDEDTRDRETFDELTIDGTPLLLSEYLVTGYPGDGSEIDLGLQSVTLEDGEDVEFGFNGWEGDGNIAGETFALTLWTADGETVTARVTPN